MYSIHDNVFFSIEYKKKRFHRIVNNKKEKKMKPNRAVHYSMYIVFILLMLIFVSSFASAYEEPGIEVTVKDGDTLIGISEQYLANPQNWNEVARINKMANPNLIYPNQIIIIPTRLLKGGPTQGLVSFLQGSVEFQPPGIEKWQPLFLNTKITEGSRIRTKEDSGVEITFKDGSSFLQRENTISKLQTATTRGDTYSLYRFFLEIGRATTQIKRATGRENQFLIDTPSAVAAVRGTVFRTAVDQEGATRSEVLDGIIDVEAMKQHVTVREEEGTLVKKGEAPLKPRKLLTPPVLVSMAPVYKKVPIDFQFRHVEGAVSYRAVLSRDRECKDIFREKIIAPAETFQVLDIDDGTYFLQSNSIDDIGLEGVPSEATVIKVRVNPEPPVVILPNERAEYKDKAILLKWLKVEDAVRYHIQISEDKNFEKIIQDKSDISDFEYKLEGLSLKTYYFRISSIAADNYQGEWSDTFAFTVLPD